MFEVFKSGFYIENNKHLNAFASGVINLSEEYIKFLVYRGKISSLGDLTAFDTAIDLTAELFKLEDGVLVYFKRFFEKLATPPQSEEEYINALKQFVFSVILNNLTHIYKLTDPVTNKLLRNLKYAQKEENYNVTEIFSNKYLHRKPIDFESAECMDKDVLLRLILSKNGFNHPTAKDFLNYVFDILDSQSKYLQALPLNDILAIYKEIIALESKTYNSKEAGSDAEINVHFKLLFEEIRKGFILKLNKYLNKKSFSENERACIYNIVEEVINCYLNGVYRDSIKDLAIRHYDGNATNSLCYKVEYVIGLLNTEIISLMQREEKSDVRQLSK